MAKRSGEHVSTAKPHDAHDNMQPLDAQRDESPRLPHEHDESFDSQRDQPREVMRRAHDDIAEGQVDTDRRGMPGLDEVERQRPGTAQQELPESARMPRSTPKE